LLRTQPSQKKKTRNWGVSDLGNTLPMAGKSAQKRPEGGEDPKPTPRKGDAGKKPPFAEKPEPSRGQPCPKNGEHPGKARAFSSN